jgi:hypothetical protein
VFDPATQTFPPQVSLYRNLAVLQKGGNVERGIPAWVQQRSDHWLRPGETSVGATRWPVVHCVYTCGRRYVFPGGSTNE